MVGLDLLILGYRELTVAEEDAARAADIFLRLGISASYRGNGRFILAGRQAKRVAAAFSGRVRYEIGEPRGVPSLVSVIKKHLAVVITAAILTLVYFLSGEIVWDVRVSGNESVDTEKIIDALDTAGLGVGDLWHSFSKNEVEARVLSDFREIAWISVNRRGSVAAVEVIEREGGVGDEGEEQGFFSIVADADCVIESITVKRGRAMVSAGDSVRKGDVLISGVIENERGYELVRAEGVVIGRCSATATARADKSEEEYEYKEPVHLGYRIKIFGISLNILKNSRNSAPACDIIEKEIEIGTPLGKRLPFGITLLEGRERISVIRENADEELPRLAALRLADKISEIVADGDLINLKTVGEYSDVGYETTSEIVYSRRVGASVKIGSES